MKHQTNDSFQPEVVLGAVIGLKYCWYGQNPAPPRMMTIPLSIGFYTIQTVVGHRISEPSNSITPTPVQARSHVTTTAVSNLQQGNMVVIKVKKVASSKPALG